MANELEETKRDVAKLEASVNQKVLTKSPEFQKIFNQERSAGKSVADAYESAQVSELEVQQPSVAQRAIEQKLSTHASQAKDNSTKNRAKWLLENLCQKSTTSQQTSADSGSEDLSSYGIDEYSKLAIKKITAAYHAFTDLTPKPGVAGPQPFNKDNQSGTGFPLKIQEYTEKLSSSIEDFSNTITPKLAEALKPIPLGGVVNTATGIIKDSMGAIQLLPNKIIALVDKVTPDFSNQLDSAFKAINLEALSHLPSKIMGSLRNLATALDSLLSVPFEMLSDMYNGLMGIMNAISGLIDSLMTSVMNILQKIIFQILDSILPMDQIMSFLDSVNEIASFLGDLSSMLGGFNVVTDLANQVTGFSSQFSSALQNPLGTAMAYVPGASQITGALGGLSNPQQLLNQIPGASQITGALGALRDPQQALNQFLPPGISDQISKISEFSGLGFVGNQGFSVGNVLDGLSDNFFTQAVGKLSSQLPILGPLFNKQTADIPALTNPTEPAAQEFRPSAENSSMQVGTGNTVQIQDTSKYQIFSEKTRQDAAETVQQGPFKAAFDLSNPNLWDTPLLPGVPAFPTSADNKFNIELGPTKSLAQEINKENDRRKAKGLPLLNSVGELPRSTNSTGLADI